MKDLEHDRFVDYTSVYESCSNSMCEHLLQDTSDIIFEPWLRPAILFVYVCFAKFFYVESRVVML